MQRKGSTLAMWFLIILALALTKSFSQAPTGMGVHQKPRILVLNTGSLDRPDIAEEIYQITQKQLSSFSGITLINPNQSFKIPDSLESSKFSNTQMHSHFSYLADSCKADHILVVSLVSMSQEGLAPSTRGFMDAAAQLIGSIFYDNTLQQYPDSVETNIHVTLDRLDYNITKGIPPRTHFSCKGSHKGGNIDRSTSDALDQLEDSMEKSLREFFNMDHFLISKSENSIEMDAGQLAGITKNTIWKIVRGSYEPELDQDIPKLDSGKLFGKTYYSKTTTYSEKPTDTREIIGYAVVTKTTPNTSVANILRCRKPIQESDLILEKFTSMKEWSLKMESGINGNQQGFRFSYHVFHHYPWMWSAAIGYQNIRDSRGTRENGFSFGGSYGFRFYNTGKWLADFEVPLQIAFSFRNDDESKSVSAGILSICPTLQLAYKLSDSKDLVFGSGYRYGSHTSFSRQGENSDKSGNPPGVWNNNQAPKLNVNGLVLSFALRFPLFGN